MHNQLLDNILHLIDAEHTQLCKRDLPKIAAIFDTLIKQQDPYDEELMDLASSFDELKSEIEIHILEEQQFLLPLCRRVLTDEVRDNDEVHSIRRTVESFASQHDEFDKKCSRLIENCAFIHAHQEEMLDKAELTDLLCDVKLLLSRHDEKEHHILFPVLLHHCDTLLEQTKG